MADARSGHGGVILSANISTTITAQITVSGGRGESFNLFCMDLLPNQSLAYIIVLVSVIIMMIAKSAVPAMPDIFTPTSFDILFIGMSVMEA